MGEESEKNARSTALRRLISARILNDCVEQFHVFSTECDVEADLLDSFMRYEGKILSALQLRREDAVERLEADILLINAEWVLEQSRATHIEYWRHVPRLFLKRSSSGAITKPLAGKGVATYVVWMTAQGKAGVAVCEDVGQSPKTIFYQEESDSAGGSVTYRAHPPEDMYMPVPRVSGGSSEPPKPPYCSIMSVPITRTIKAYGDPLGQPELECIGVLNITHPKPTPFSEEDYAWAMTCASLLGSLHASLYARLPKGGHHPNEILLDSRRQRKKRVENVTSSSTTTPTHAIRADHGFTPSQLVQGRITPWSCLHKDDFLIKRTKIDDETETTILQRLEKYGFVLLRLGAITPEKEMLIALENSLGPALDKQNDHVGKIKTITPKTGVAANTGDSAAELGAHVDGTQDDPLPPAILAFQYLEGATVGGHSTFYDMADVLMGFAPEERSKIVTDLAQRDAAVCRKTKAQENGKPDWIGEYRGALVKTVCGHALSLRVRFDDDKDSVLSVEPTYQPSFDKLKSAVLARDQSKRVTFIAQEGDIAIFDNWRIMHGRLAVTGKHARHHNRFWIKDLALRHQGRYLLGVRGPSVALIHAVREGNGDA